MYISNKRILPAGFLSVLILGINTSISGALTYEDIRYEPHNKATGTVTAVTRSVGDQIEYAYEVENLQTSERPIISFRVQFDVPVSSLTPSGPSRWRAFSCCRRDKHRRNALGITVGGWLYGEDGADIQPGAALSGFTLRVRSVPAIKRFFIESASPTAVPTAEPGNEEELRALDELTDFFNESTSGFTLGPDPIPDSVDAAGLIDRSVALKHQCASVGWLRGNELIAKLDRKLDEAKAALGRGQSHAARQHLEQFIQTLEQQRALQQKRQQEASEQGKERREARPQEDKRFLDDNCFYLLKPNAEFILFKLSQAP